MAAHNVTLFIRSLPTTASNERLEEICSEIGPVKQCFVVNEKGTNRCRGFGYVTYPLEEDAQRAMKEIKEYDGKEISLSLAKRKIIEKKKTAKTKQAEELEEPAPTQKEAASTQGPPTPNENKQKSKSMKKVKLKSKLIIRNLSFQCSEEDLKKTFAKFGTVLEANIPLKPDGKKRGFAFVLFKNVCEASQALNEMNMKEIKGRQVAVDWAIPKDKFVATQPSNKLESKKQEEGAAEQPATECDSGEEEEEEEDKSVVSHKKASVKSDEGQTQEDMDEEVADYEEGESVASSDEDDNSSLESDDGDSDNSDDDDSECEDSDDDDEEEEEEEMSDAKKTKRNPLPSDVKEGRTVFIRNLSFDTVEEGLEEVLLQYGEVNYIRIVYHQDTGHSKGCAFAQFKRKESADKCIAAAAEEEESGGIRVDGRKLAVVAAVSREDAAKLRNKKVKMETGTRNLYLAREGLIRAGTKAAEGISEADMAKRVRFEQMKRMKLRDLNVFVSKTRLCIHNLPRSVDNKKLKEICLRAVKGEQTKRIHINECRVMYDKKPEKGQVLGHSLGYGFVQFQDHDHALAALRHLNNNPDIFGSQKRLIVEFSLEDGKKLQMKEMRQCKNKERFRNRSMNVKGKPKNSAGSGLNSNSSFPAQAKKDRGSPKSPNKGMHYSGFQTNPEVEHVEQEDGKKRRKVLPLPSHQGPKIRMRNKGKQQALPSKKPKVGPSRKDRLRGQLLQKPTMMRAKSGKGAKRNFNRRDMDRFDGLVEQYKKKLMGNGNKITNVKRNKWFNN